MTEGVTGTFFDNADPDSLAEAVRRFDPAAVDPAACVRAAQRFDTLRFQGALARIVEDAVEKETSRDRPPAAPEWPRASAASLQQEERADAPLRRVGPRHVVVQQPAAVLPARLGWAREPPCPDPSSARRPGSGRRSRSRTISRCTGALVTTPGAAMS